MRVPVLTYHAGNVASNDYAGNDHVALAVDLHLLADKGWRVVPLSQVVEQRLGLASHDLHRCVALSCDDGTALDLHDLDYPGFGPQRGFLGCLRDAEATHGVLLHMSTFVIADPQARALMDRHCLHDLGWMDQSWWNEAQASGRMAIECHSWDHNHEVMPGPGVEGMLRGDFHAVDTPTRAASQIDRALEHINAVIAPARCRFFAYPYGHANDYLVRDYLPRRGPALGLQAAFGVQGEPVTMASDRWHLPRYICGWHWRSPDELAAILAACAGD